MKNTFLLIAKITLLITINFICSVIYGQKIGVGAHQTESYFPMLKNKNIAIVANPTSVFSTSNGFVHIVDSLNNNFTIVKILSPEHGFRGKADNGEKVVDTIDIKTGIPIQSLYGKNKKPTKEMLDGIETIVFDIQDVGVRFYTYLSTLYYIMQSCAENNISLIVLDRPNPNGHYVDGPVLELKQFKSFIGIVPIPIVHGMTLGELAQMINGENWLGDTLKCDLSVIKMKNYTHQTPYELPIRPSPNLPNSQSIALYPSLCLLEQTPISVGRGTDMQFQIYGSPHFLENDFSFTPQPNFGAKFPKLNGEKCYGIDLRNEERPKKLHLKWLIDAYNKFPNKETFFKKSFNRLAGNATLQEQIKEGLSEEQIRDTWQKDLKIFKQKRKLYLLYP